MELFLAFGPFNPFAARRVIGHAFSVAGELPATATGTNADVLGSTPPRPISLDVFRREGFGIRGVLHHAPIAAGVHSESFGCQLRFPFLP